MAVAEQSKFFVNLTGGLNTDATKLTFPENAFTDGDNVDVLRNGEIRRRLGVDFEDAYELSDLDIDPNGLPNNSISTHEWEAVNGKGEVNFLGIQIGDTIYFHDLGEEPTGANLRGSISFAPFVQGNGVPGDSLVSSSFGEGVMILTNPNMDPIIVEYDEDTDSFSATVINIEIRDFDGLDDGLRTDEQPNSLSINHRYNLLNQGWPLKINCNNRLDGDRGITKDTDPVVFTHTKLGFYPSNADIIYLAKAQAADDPEVIGTYSAFHLNTGIFGNTPAPAGHYILPLFDQDRQSAMQRDATDPRSITGNGTLTPGIQSSVRPSQTAFYAGRMWFAGIPDKDLAGNVYFSQSLTDMSNAGKCYQANDPTAEDVNSLLASDGGVIPFADMGQVYKMIPIGEDLLIVAGNGVWSISGTGGANFAADDFTARKITDVGANSSDSVVEANTVLYYWNSGGIYGITANTNRALDERESVVRITRDKIQDFFDLIPEAGRAYSRGFYDQYENRIYWFYNDTPGYDGIEFRFSYNRVLVLDLTLTAFYTYSIGDLALNSPFVAAMTQKTPGSETVVQYDVVQRGDDVEQGGDEVVQDMAFPSFADVQLKLLTLVVAQDGNYEYTFSEFKDTNYVDWITWDQFINDPLNTGTDFTSYIQAGWQHLGDLIRVKKITHLDSMFNVTETGYSTIDGEVVFDNPSGCFVQTRWEYTGQDNGRWTTPAQAYKLKQTYIPENDSDPFDYGFEIAQSKLAMRGSGKAFSVRYESESGKDFQLLGYAVNIRQGAKV